MVGDRFICSFFFLSFLSSFRISHLIVSEKPTVLFSIFPLNVVCTKNSSRVLCFYPIIVFQITHHPNCDRQIVQFSSDQVFRLFDSILSPPPHYHITSVHVRHEYKLLLIFKREYGIYIRIL